MIKSVGLRFLVASAVKLQQLLLQLPRTKGDELLWDPIGLGSSESYLTDLLYHKTQTKTSGRRRSPIVSLVKRESFDMIHMIRTYADNRHVMCT